MSQESCSIRFERTNSKNMYCGAPALFPKQCIAKPTWLIFPNAVVNMTLPSLPCLEFPKERGSAADNNVPSLAVIRVLLSGNPPFQGLHCPHPLTSSLPSPPSPASQWFQGFMEMKSCSSSQKRLEEIKWLTLILFGNPSELPSLNIHLACWKGNLFQKHWTELTNSLCM